MTSGAVAATPAAAARRLATRRTRRANVVMRVALAAATAHRFDRRRRAGRSSGGDRRDPRRLRRAGTGARSRRIRCRALGMRPALSIRGFRVRTQPAAAAASIVCTCSRAAPIATQCRLRRLRLDRRLRRCTWCRPSDSDLARRRSHGYDACVASRQTRTVARFALRDRNSAQTRVALASARRRCECRTAQVTGHASLRSCRSYGVCRRAVPSARLSSSPEAPCGLDE